MTKSNSRKKVLDKVFLVIKKNPGIRPREINRLLNKKHTASLRNTLTKKGLVKKIRKGITTHYYPILEHNQKE